MAEAKPQWVDEYEIDKNRKVNKGPNGFFTKAF